MALGGTMTSPGFGIGAGVVRMKFRTLRDARLYVDDGLGAGAVLMVDPH